MFLESFRVTSLASAQIFILGAVGYFLVKKNILSETGLNSISRLVIELTLPALIFCQLIKDFSFSLYPRWWAFPLLSIGVNFLGLAAGFLFCGLVRKGDFRLQFLSAVTFQNSGYLPLALIAALIPQDKAGPMLVYLFLFLIGFNLTTWSLGVYMLTFTRARRFALGSLFSPPVITAFLSLVIIFLGLNRFIPHTLIKPLRMIGDCTLPLALLVVGGNLAAVRLKGADKKAVSLMVLAKLIILPALALLFVVKFDLALSLGMLILIEFAMPPATSLSLIIRHYKKDDLFISQAVFWGHILSLVSVPVFLSLYFAIKGMP
ncbi:MAG: AEC family transporter [Candidatus Omnitrophica bacterium]|nr:AEC family transporter [Candidatus Omnitrophota bacterium]